MTTTVTHTDEAQIRALLDEQRRGLAEHDPELITATYADDIVIANLAPPLVQTSWDTEAIRAWMSGFDGPIGSELRDLVITVDGDLAFCHCLRSMTSTPKGAPGEFTMWFRSTTALRRIDGRWLVTYLHESVPFYMDGSFRAATDLTA